MTKRNWRTHVKTRYHAVERITRPSFCGLGVAVLFLVAVPGCQAATARAPMGEATAPAAAQLLVGAEQFPDEDAINVRWEQHWTLEKDGTVRRRDHRWLKLLNSRPIRRHADPRIDFCKGQDELIIHTAQTHLPDGTVMPVPDYSFNLAGPDDVGNWPHYAAWQQQVICFSAVMDDAVLELDYEVVTRPGVLPWIDADLRLDDAYPSLERGVSVTVPEGTVLHRRVDGPIAGASEPVQSSADGKTTFTWTFADVPGTPAEPQSKPWRQRCPRLRFSTCPDAGTWASTIIQCVEQAAGSDDAVKTFAQVAVEDEADPTERVRKVAKKLGDSFNFLNSHKTYRSLKCRTAGDVLHSNYGSPLESAALLSAVYQALGLQASVEVAVDATVWDEQVPTGSAFAGIVVVANTPDGPIYVHPQHGVFRTPGGFGKHWLLGVSESGSLRASYVEARGEKTPSDIQITGKVTIDEDGKATGELRFRLTGGFYDPLKLATAAQQETLVKNLVGRVLDDFTVSGHSIATLSDEVLRATASVTSKDALKSYEKQHLLTLGAGPAFLSDFPLPLGRSYRKTEVHLDGLIRENVDVTIELPEKWSAVIVPATLKLIEGPWGAVGQKVETKDQTVRFRRLVDIKTESISPADFATLREAINTLRAARSLHLACGE